LLTVGLLGCTGPAPAAPAATSAPTPSGVAERCGPPDTSAEAVSIPSTGATLVGYEVGSGSRGVVLIPELGALNLCGWWPYAAYLAGHGYHVLLFDHRCTGRSSCPGASKPNDLMDDLVAVTARLHEDGAAGIVLIGASQGAAEAVILGSRPPVGLLGVIALSADELTDPLAAAPYPSTATAAAHHLRLPSLFVVAADDPYVSVVDSRRFEATVPAGDTRLVVEPAGRGHGWDLLSPAADGSRTSPDPEILAFLNRVLPPPCPASGPVGGRVPVSLLGTGRVTVVLSNQSDEDMCAWMPFATVVVSAGYRVALWNYGGDDPRTELAAVISTLAGHPIVLMGASKGAKTSLLTAKAAHPDDLIGIVGLSAEAILNPGIDVAKGSAGLTTPTLLVTAVDDPYGSADALPEISRGLAHAQVLRVPGSDHGTDLLKHPEVASAVLAFLGQLSPPQPPHTSPT
jgi:pimeloyl-ACP methyl ester carboxylesterase